MCFWYYQGEIGNMDNVNNDTRVEPEYERQAEIWAVGGGKGGTGKTFVACQLACSLAARDKKTILIDTDFGGANVHTFFGVKSGARTIASFFDKKTDLVDLVTETQVQNLSIIPGNTRTVAPANIKYAQKIKLFRHIKHLDADYVILDLGGGTTLDTIDSFLLADKLIVVTIPEITAIENLYQFIKSVYFRKLKSLFGVYGVKDTAKHAWDNKTKHGIKTIGDLLDFLKSTSDNMDMILSKELENFGFEIILNKVRNARELQEGFSIKSACIKYIGVNARYSGYVEYDFQFWRNLSLIQIAPRFVVSHSTQNEVEKITGNIISGEQMNIGSLTYI